MLILREALDDARDYAANRAAFDRNQRRDPRVLELGAHDLRQLALDLLGDAAGAGKILGHGRRLLQGSSNLDDFIDLELIADLDVVVTLERQAAFEARFHFADIVLESLQ